jgi:hypothetical protein
MTGAAAVLTVGMLAVGCSDDGDTIIQGGQGPLNNQDNFPASSIFANQVSVDGGGVSPNDTNVTGVRVIWACDICWSDGNFQGDSSALVLFTTAGGNNATAKLWVTHYNGQGLTQPVTLIGTDQDEQNGVANAGNVLGSAVALQLNTQNYFQNNQGNQQNLQTITQNDKVWVLLYSATTFTNNPVNGDGTVLSTQVQTVGSSIGRHRTIYYTAFRPGSRNNNLETRTDFIGSGTTSVNLQFGWVLPAIEVIPANARSGVAFDIGNNNTPAGPTPSSDVQSFGLISDGYAGQTQFSGTGLPLQGGALGSPAATSYTRAVATPGALGAASFNGGEQTQIVQLFYTQVLNSLATGGGSVARSGNGTFIEGGARLAAFNASFNLATLQFETPTEFNPAVRRNATTSLSTSPGTGFYPTFFGYNNHVFYKYADASLVVTVNADPLAMGGGSQGIYDNTGADGGGNLNPATFHEDIPGVATFQDDGDGTSSLVTGSTLDLSSFNSAPGVHDIVNPPATGVAVTVNREIANFNTSGGQPFIFGSDESLGDTTIFYSMADNTSGGTGDLTPNTYVRGGYAAAINNGTVGTLGSLVAGSPFAWSTHAGAQQNAFIVTQASGATNVLDDPLVAPGQLNGGDGNHNIGGPTTTGPNDEDQNGGVYTGSVNYFVPVMNRSGEYVSLGYMQDTGISSSTTTVSFHRGLKVVTYQAFQTFQSNSANSVGGLTQVNLNLRFSAPQEISQTGATVSLLQDPNALTGIDTNAETNTRWDAVPVSNFSAQSLVNYRCAFQSNNRIIHYLWEQSDGTGDRGWSRQITYVTNVSGTPGAATLGTIIEYETGNLVSGHLNTLDNNITSPEISSFTFLDGNLNPANGTAFYGTDLGAQDQNNQGIQGALGTNAGSLIVFFHKITDATNTDGDFGNVELITSTVINNTLGNRISLGRAIDENLPLAGANNVPGVVGVQVFNQSTNVFANYLTAASAQNTTLQVTGNAGYLGTGSFAFLSLPNNADLINNANYQPNAIYVYFTGPSGTNGSSFRALLTRKLDLTAYRQAGSGMTGTPGVTNTFFTPSAGATGPGSVGFLDPTRLDHNLSAHVFALSTAQNNTSAGLLWRQDDHVYGQGTNDGIAYVTQNGGPNPPLVDQDSKTDVVFYALSVCTNAQGDAGDGIINFFKFDDDTNGTSDIRLQQRNQFRVGQ